MLRAADNSLVEVVRGDDGTVTVTPEGGSPVVVAGAGDVAALGLPEKQARVLAAFVGGES